MKRLKVMILYLVAFALVFPLIGHAQGKEMATKTYHYQIKGRLEAVDLTEGWAIIGGLQWELADDFQTDDFRFSKGERAEFKRSVWVIFFVRCTEAVQSENAEKGEGIERIRGLDLIKKINEMGCKIYNIERLPM
ncbi:MAG: hypothetical protein JRI46_10960 [Deltaproteobacteria bacterium]|nr:hypothetical protein [Deltaproteobacteria bacterium]